MIYSMFFTVHTGGFIQQHGDIITFKNISSDTIVLIQRVGNISIHHDVGIATQDLGGGIQAALEEVFTSWKNRLR